MLNRASGNSSRASASSGIGSVPPTLACRTCAPRQLGDRPAAVGDPVQPRVVEDDQLAVGGGLHVGLEVAVALVDGPAERRHGVLQAGQIADVPAAMGEGPGRVAVQKAGHRRSLARPRSPTAHGPARSRFRRPPVCRHRDDPVRWHTVGRCPSTSACPHAGFDRRYRPGSGSTRPVRHGASGAAGVAAATGSAPASALLRAGLPATRLREPQRAGTRAPSRRMPWCSPSRSATTWPTGCIRCGARPRMSRRRWPSRPAGRAGALVSEMLAAARSAERIR